MSKFIAMASATGGASSGVKETLAQAEGWATNHLSNQKNADKVEVFELKEPIAVVRRIEAPFKTEYAPTYQKDIPPAGTKPIEPSNGFGTGETDEAEAA